MLIVLVAVVIGSCFATQITSWFGDVMTDLATHTENIFNFGTSTPII